MKRKSSFLILAIMIALNGCLIKSLHPFYKEADIKFRRDLIGVWLDQDSSVWKIEQYKHSKGLMQGDTLVNSYIITTKEEGSPESVFIGSLFQLKGIYYLDFFPVMDELFDGEFHSFHLIPTHSLAKVDIVNPEKVNISWFNEEWLVGLFEQNKVKIPHEKVKLNNKEDAYVLTASTDELQKFIIKYGDNPDIYQCDKNGFCIFLSKTDEI